MENLNEKISKIFDEIEKSSLNKKSENNIKGLFSGIDFGSANLGSNIGERNKNLMKIISRINELDLGEFKNKSIDIFDDAYEYLMGMYASKAGKSGGEFFTPQEVSRLLTLLAIGGKKKVNRVYDPTCGSGSLLLQSIKILGYKNIRDKLCGQESNPTTYNLCRMNMILHNVGYDKFDIRLWDTLIDPKHPLDVKYDVIVSNPPYSIQWEGNSNPILINDSWFSEPGILAPKSKADFAFILHALYLLEKNGKAAIVCFPGIFYRNGAEQKIRKYLVDNNYIESIISLPENLFYGTSITTNIMVWIKN